MWGLPENIMESFLYDSLKPIATALESIVKLRNWAYSNGYLKSYHVSIPVISIGNISVGGTGKTPITIDLAERLIASGKKVAILSRGYKRKSSQKNLVVSNGKEILCDVTAAGDEPYLMASCVPQAVVIVGAQRTISARMAVEQYNADIILLDDGYQHRALARDIDMVLIDYNSYPYKDNLLPAGRLREPLSALSRASDIVITKVPENPNMAKIDYLINLISKYAPDARQYQSSFLPDKFVSVVKQESAPLKDLIGVNVVAFCGIASPESFFQQLSILGLKIVTKEVFSDHHWYNKADIEHIQDLLKKSNAFYAITTAKDAVRLNSIIDIDDTSIENFEAFLYLEMRLKWLNDKKPILDSASIPV